MKKNENQDAGFIDLGFAKPDTLRMKHQGVAEVIYGESKTATQIAEIAKALLEAGQKHVLVTRISKEKAIEIDALLDEDKKPEYFAQGNIAIFGGMPSITGKGSIWVVCAGTSDVSVAEEAALTAEFLGNDVRRLYDVGVAGIHRLLSYEEDLQQARVIVAVAGMEGALASVVAGLVKCPVIAVPTSVGYGAAFGGVSALLSMLNSCASGVSVVNIDNGFGAAYQASSINHL